MASQDVRARLACAVRVHLRAPFSVFSEPVFLTRLSDVRHIHAIIDMLPHDTSNHRVLMCLPKYQLWKAHFSLSETSTYCMN